MAKLKGMMIVGLFALFFCACSSGSGSKDSLTRMDIQKLLANYYGVSIEDIQIIDSTSAGNDYSASHKLKKNGEWEPEGKGFYLAQINKDEKGEYKVTVPKFDDNSNQ